MYKIFVDIMTEILNTMPVLQVR